MSENSELDLLADIAKLLGKYGVNSFEQLSSRLANPEFAKSLSLVLEKVASEGRKANVLKKEKKSPILQRDFRHTLLAQETEKANILVKLYDDLMAKSILPSMRDLETFSLDNNLPKINATSRQKAVIPFLKTLLPLPLEDLILLLAKLKPRVSSDDRSLEGWSNIILDKNKTTKPEK
jgi:hypothetical protein